MSTRNENTAPSVPELSCSVRQIHASDPRKSIQVLRLYQDHVRQCLSAKCVTWTAAYRGKFGRDLWYTDLMSDWKAVAAIYPRYLEPTHERQRLFKRYIELAKSDGLDPMMAWAIKHAGATRVHRNGDFISPQDWSEHWMAQWLSQDGIGERMVGVVNLGPKCESYLLIDRGIDAEPFNAADAELLLQLITEFPRVHYNLMLERGLCAPASQPLSPRQQEILKMLLGPLSEKEIAGNLGISRGTVHNRIVEIYKIFAVNSRFELCQLWLEEVAVA